VSAVLIEREPRVGDNWRHRYSSLVLHNQVWANHLPYLKFPASWPAYLSKDELADWLETYASVMSLDVWTSTEITGARYDETAARWTVTLRRVGGSGTGTVTELHPRHVVLATGVFGVAHRLEIPGAADFTGHLLHATEYTGGTPAAGVRALVVGCGGSAHHVAQDLYEAGVQVTMLQRSSTCVVSLEPGRPGRTQGVPGRPGAAAG
jgi:cation diffusion facilitator CzcD-associated flavoprotein CzcO